MIRTGPIASRANPRLDAIRAANIGHFTIANNVVILEWDHPNVAGIGMFSQFADWPLRNAMVVGNEVILLPPGAPSSGDVAAGIEVRGFAVDNMVVANVVRGRSRAAYAVDRFNGGAPSGTTFVIDRAVDFIASRADFYIGAGATGTRLVASPGSIEDHGTGTTVGAN